MKIHFLLSTLYLFFSLFFILGCGRKTALEPVDTYKDDDNWLDSYQIFCWLSVVK